MPEATEHVATGHLVLVADDFPDIRDLYRDVLHLTGFPVVTADDGVEAVEVARRTRPAIILLDVRMPRLSGLDAMRQLRSEAAFAGVPIVALTAHAFPMDREMLLQAGFDAVVAKPCLPDVILETVESLLQKSHPASA
jgi:CheY-like chemotaxis protein